MAIRVRTLSNTERQRQFRERNPGYYGRLHAKRRAEVNAMIAQCAAEATAATPVPLALAAPVMTIPLPTRLALPAPVEQPEIATINRFKTMQSARVLIERSRAA